MKAKKLQVFDPPMCCSSGVCGPGVDPTLARFSGDLDWLQKQGVEVERFNLSSHPAAFAAHELVKQALTVEGPDCLPLIVVDGRVIRKRGYSDRAEMAQACGVEVGTGSAGDSRKNGLPDRAADQAVACGPGCACGPNPRARGAKVAVCLAVFAAVATIFVYKAFAEKRDTPSGDSTGFITVPAPDAKKDQATHSTGGDSRIGKYLESMAELNKVALDQDAVFIFIPTNKDEPASEATRSAVLTAHKTLGSKNIKVGLYTLKATSPEYASIAPQVQAPAILVACKGRGMGAVTGEVTETKLLQVYVASSRGGGCGPGASGCAPGACQ